jgi:hypothetical protein
VPFRSPSVQKGLLGMDKCQSRHFAAQIAHVSIACLQFISLPPLLR